MRMTIASALAMIVACTGGSGSTSGGGGSGSVAGICSAVCDWRVRCNKPDTDCQAECSRDTATYEGKWSAAYTGAVQSCFQTLACDGNDDTCIANFAAADSAHPNVPEVQACLARRSECSQSTPPPDGGSST